MMTDFTPQLYELFRQSIAEYCGIRLTDEQRGDFEKNIQLRMSALHLQSPFHYLNFLTNGNIREWDELIPLIANNETFFFREPIHFEILKNRLFPELLKERRTLRVWSAGCATGEEAYSLAIALFETRLRCGEFDAHVIGTDIDHAALDSARAGEYGRNSFRGTPDDIRRNYFTEKSDRTTYKVDARIKSMTQFTYMNLLQPSHGAEFANLDVIFFRNVSIYFSRSTIERVHRNLMNALRPGGYLFVASSETLHHNLGYRLVEMEKAFFYKKEKAASPAPKPVPAIRKVFSFLSKPLTSKATLAEILQLYQDGLYDEVLKIPARQYAEEDRVQIGILKTLVYMGQERWQDAERTNSDLLLDDPVNAEGYLLRGLIEMYQHRPEKAESALRKALFLNADLGVAHFYLGKLLLECGKASEAQRSFRNTIRILEKETPRSMTFRALGHSTETIREACKQYLTAVT